MQMIEPEAETEVTKGTTKIKVSANKTRRPTHKKENLAKNQTNLATVIQFVQGISILAWTA